MQFETRLITSGFQDFVWCAGEDSNLRRPKPTGLQPVVIDHSTTDAFGNSADYNRLASNDYLI